MYRRYVLTLAARSRLKPCMRALNACDPPPTLPNSSSSLSFLPIFSSARMQYATSGRGRRPSPKKAADDGDDDFDDDDDDDDYDEVEDNSGYEMDYDTWNLLHQGKKEDEKSRKWPLPMYKAREMVDYHMIKNRLDGLKVITDPKLEYELRKQLHEGLVDFYRRTQTAFDEIDAAQSKEAVEGGEKKEVLQIAEGETKNEESGDQGNTVEVVSSSQVDLEDKEAESDQQLKAHTEGEIATEENEAQSQFSEPSPSTTLEAGEVVSTEESGVEPTDAAMTSAVDDVIKDVFTVPELTTIGSEKNVVEFKSEGTADDEVNVFNYDNWVAYREQEMAKRYAEEEQKKHATLRWKIQLVLGPGDVWHPANRKASVSVYVRELGLSKHAKQRLLALVGKRYKSPKDELTIVSERYQHRYENQKDVLRTLLDLIEEAKKADQLVNDARIGFLKAQNTELKAARTGLVAT